MGSVTPSKGGGGGGRKSFHHAEGGAQEVSGSFYTVALSFSHIEVGPQVSTL